jgi:undecaprenyl pyrophosphate phosphatase UppP
LLFENNLNYFATGWRNRTTDADDSFAAKYRHREPNQLGSNGNFVAVFKQGIVSCLRTLTPFPVRSSLGRSYAACFGCIALVTSILLGLANGELPDSILTQTLTFTLVFAVLGWVFGVVADQVVRQSVEMNYRDRFEKLRQARQSKEPS